jgi:hypothetical protein
MAIQESSSFAGTDLKSAGAATPIRRLKATTSDPPLSYSVLAQIQIFWSQFKM